MGVRVMRWLCGREARGNKGRGGSRMGRGKGHKGLCVAPQHTVCRRFINACNQAGSKKQGMVHAIHLLYTDTSFCAFGEL
eukprot:35110-Chlamydomonas_euryale.AAC.2